MLTLFDVFSRIAYIHGENQYSAGDDDIRSLIKLLLGDSQKLVMTLEYIDLRL